MFTRIHTTSLAALFRKADESTLKRGQQLKRALRVIAHHFSGQPQLALFVSLFCDQTPQPFAACRIQQPGHVLAEQLRPAEYIVVG